MEHIISVILAAGQGTRMKSELPKVLHPLFNRPLLEYVVETARAAGTREQVVVVGHGGSTVRQTMEALPCAASCRFVTQEPQLGTGHAMQIAMPAVSEHCDCLLVLYGDTPLIRVKTIKALLEHFAASKAAAMVLSATQPNPQGYGRILRDDQGRLIGIVEQKDANEAQQNIRETNTGIYCFAPGPLKAALANLKNDNAQGEYYLTDVIAAMHAQGLPVEAVCLAEPEEIMGINDRQQLAVAHRILQNRVNTAWMLAGVTIVDPATTYIDMDVNIGRDTIIEPQTYLRAGSSIGENCHLGVGTEISASNLGNGVTTRHAIIVESEIGDNCDIGPFAYIRPGSVLAANVKAGHFVELKKARVGKGSKIPHLSYVGDAVLGSGVNIGCGTITCNYDGINKHTTTIGDGAFIGSNTNFVAPVEIGANAITGAGSTITRNVPDNALAIERAEQVNIPGWRNRKR